MPSRTPSNKEIGIPVKYKILKKIKAKGDESAKHIECTQSTSFQRQLHEDRKRIEEYFLSRGYARSYFTLRSVNK